MADIRHTDQVISHVCINTMNTWSNFCRAYYLSAFLNARLESGGKIIVAPTTCTYSNAIGGAIQVYRPAATPNTLGMWARREEPTWHDPNVLLRLSNVMGFSNHGDIQAAFSIGTRAFVDLPVVRNYFAHKNKESRIAAARVGLNYALSPQLAPINMLLTVLPAFNQALLLQWIDEISITVEMLCK